MRRRVPKLQGRERKRVRRGEKEAAVHSQPVSHNTMHTHTHTHTSRAAAVESASSVQWRERERWRRGERGLLTYAVACAQMKEAKNEVANDRQGELRAGSTGVPFSSGGQNDGLSIMHSISKIQNEFPVDAIELGTHTHAHMVFGTHICIWNMTYGAVQQVIIIFIKAFCV